MPAFAPLLQLLRLHCLEPRPLQFVVAVAELLVHAAPCFCILLLLIGALAAYCPRFHNCLCLCFCRSLLRQAWRKRGLVRFSASRRCTQARRLHRSCCGTSMPRRLCKQLRWRLSCFAALCRWLLRLCHCAANLSSLELSRAGSEAASLLPLSCDARALWPCLPRHSAVCVLILGVFSRACANQGSSNGSGGDDAALCTAD